jgi:hypothetical protein
MSSDKISGARKPLILLKLETIGPNNTPKEQLIELDVAELGQLLKSLRAAQKVSDILHS